MQHVTKIYFTNILPLVERVVVVSIGKKDQLKIKDPRKND